MLTILDSIYFFEENTHQILSVFKLVNDC